MNFKKLLRLEFIIKSKEFCVITDEPFYVSAIKIEYFLRFVFLNEISTSKTHFVISSFLEVQFGTVQT